MHRMLKISMAAIAAALVAGDEVSAETKTIAVIPFGFIDTSGEARDQSSDHARRRTTFLDLLNQHFREGNSFNVILLPELEHFNISRDLSSAAKVVQTSGADYMLIGQIKKMSTLVGQIKFAVIDVRSNTALCDRYLTYRGDSDEAWRRAAIYTVRDALSNCWTQ